ncbi:uncharacterized protein LOC117182206 [Belonocnema kinseyi]|uniref:uncharacterized protein LOC117182206 n=1 Tax=Belonocnema kinseyi TaxID=2817044 RepID=UPI00143D3DF0|nr:uncharacterized protein LOC117182206 [Belonocnema kinseyi]
MPADEILYLDEYTIFVEMGDGTTFEGNMHPMSEELIPNWMQPNGARYHDQISAFIRTAKEPKEPEYTGHTGTLLRRSNRPSKFSEPYPYGTDGPVYAQMRLGGALKTKYFTAKSFQKYLPTRFHFLHFPCFPPTNQIYITRPGGPVYTARLEEYNPSAKHIGKTSHEHN